MGKGIFGKPFDFDNDGKLDAIEQAADLIAFEKLSKDTSDSDGFDDYEDEDDEYSYDDSDEDDL